ncbi:MAG: site-specific recombinase XerD [Ilumatobacteraceae bacterium]|nr:site-specific recombinase XerD [Ilumatobacteraceae bacterium]
MSVEKLPSGKYRAVVRHAGQKATSAAVMTQAEAKMLEAQLKLTMGGTPGKGGHTVAEVVDGYIRDGAARLSPGSIDFYRKGEAAIPAAFASREVLTITPVIVSSMYRELRSSGASEHKIRKVHRLLSAAFNRAVRYGWLTSNPCQQADKPKAQTKEIQPPTPAQVRAIIESAAQVNEDLQVYLRLAATTGVRRGEGVALKWIDVADDQIHVRRSLVESDDQLIERPTKTGTRGHRKIAVGRETMAALEALRVRQAAQATEQGLPAPVWVFSHDLGLTPWRPHYLTLAFGRLSDHTHRLHDLRHYAATQQLAAGVPVTTVSKRLGHASTAVTLDVYGHWLPEQDRGAADLMEGLLA